MLQNSGQDLGPVKMRPEAKRLKTHQSYLLIIILQLTCLLVQYSHATYKQPVTSPNQESSALDSNEANLGHQNFLDTSTFTDSTDEAKLRLINLIDDKVDTNKDGLIQLDELVSWLRLCQDKYATEEVKRLWTSFGKSFDDGSIDWDEYRTKEYDDVLSLTRLERNLDNVNIKSSHDVQLRRDERRWKAADANHDGKLSEHEFKSFIHPEQDKMMHDLLVEEKLISLDKDRDSRISFDEYIADVPNESGILNVVERDKWLAGERHKFSTIWDTNHDNFLDKSELFSLLNHSEWDDHSIAEAQHLMQSADIDRDHRLSKDEILGAYHEFVNSHVTDFGEALRDYHKALHDEL